MLGRIKHFIIHLCGGSSQRDVELDTRDASRQLIQNVNVQQTHSDQIAGGGASNVSASKWLNLSGKTQSEKLTPADVESLFDQIKSENIRIVSLRDEILSEDALVTLAEKIKCDRTIHMLDFRGHKINYAVAQLLYDALSHNTVISTCSYDHNKEYDTDLMRQIAFNQVLANTSNMHSNIILDGLRFKNKPLNRDEKQQLYDNMKQKVTLTYLAFVNGIVNSDNFDIGSIVQILTKQEQINRVDLRDNNLDDVSVISILNTLTGSKSLESLNLSGNTLGSMCAKYIIGFLAATPSVKMLNIEGHSMGDELNNALVQFVLEHQNLKILGIPQDLSPDIAGSAKLDQAIDCNVEDTTHSYDTHNPDSTLLGHTDM